MTLNTHSTKKRIRSASRPQLDIDKLFHGYHPTTPRSLWRNIRSSVRLSAILLWLLVGCGIQTIMFYCPKKTKQIFALFFWKKACWILGIHVNPLGTKLNDILNRQDGRKVVFIPNHTSWIDIIVLGSLLPTCFVAKVEVKNWPIIGMLTKLAGSVYVTRHRREASKNVRDVQDCLRKGNNITFFPEGTTTDGTFLKPFLSTLFSLAKPSYQNRGEESPLVLFQPISIVYDRLEGLHVGKSRRASVFSWFGDMYLAPHMWSLGKWRSMRASVLFHEPFRLEDFSTRKDISSASYNIIRQGCEALRQNRFDPENPHDS